MIGPFIKYNFLDRVPRSGDHGTSVFRDDVEGRSEAQESIDLKRVGRNGEIIWSGIFCSTLW